MLMIELLSMAARLPSAPRARNKVMGVLRSAIERHCPISAATGFCMAGFVGQKYVRLELSDGRLYVQVERHGGKQYAIPK